MSETQTSLKLTQKAVGQPLRRMEDPRFITGSARFTTDAGAPNMLHAYFVRSVYAHAKIIAIDTTEATKHPSVKLVLTGETMSGEVDELASQVTEGEPPHRYPLAVGETNFQGEPVALVVADDAASALEAAELVQVDYEPLPVVVDPEMALVDGSPKVHDHLKNNLAFLKETSSGDIEQAFSEADHVVQAKFEFPRLNAVPLEPRDILASFDPALRHLTAWAPTQSPHEFKDQLASVLRLPEENVRVIVYDMGGGFGQKEFYGEYAAVCFASMKLGKPVKWVESRAENFLAATQGRGQIQYVEAAVKRDGRVLGLKVKVICDGGAFGGWSLSMPETTVAMSPGVYDIKAFSGEAMTSFTNKAPIGAYRGASRPEATYLIERTMDLIAQTLKLDPVKIRLKNFVPSNKFPYKSAGGLTYDSGDYERNLKKALELSKYEQLRDYQRSARAKGRLVGVGVITYVEVCGFGRGYPQSAAVTVTSEGKVIITSGTNPHGQGHWTPFAQIVSDELGVNVTDVQIQYGDTDSLPTSSVTAGSRSAVVGGTAILLATRAVKDKMTAVALKMLGSRDSKLVFRGGRIVGEKSGASLSFEEVAKAAHPKGPIPEGMEQPLHEYVSYEPTGEVFPFGTHVVMVEVDKETGLVSILKYVAVDDGGKVINPLIVEGQIHGGVMQGIAQALLEGVVYGEDGQLLTATLADYLVPSAVGSPHIESFRTETPSPLNPLGLKGVGEAGTIGATPAVVNAVQDAISPMGAIIDKLPLSPNYLWSLMTGRSSKN